MQVQFVGVPITLSGASLPSVYILEQVHFHWSAEHTVDGQRDPLELHLVHFDEQYGNFNDAAQYENGIVVVAVLFEVEIIFISPRRIFHWKSFKRVHQVRDIDRCLVLVKQIRQPRSNADRGGDENGDELGGKKYDIIKEQDNTFSAFAKGPYDVLSLSGFPNHPRMPGVRNVVYHD